MRRRPDIAPAAASPFLLAPSEAQPSREALLAALRAALDAPDGMVAVAPLGEDLAAMAEGAGRDRWSRAALAEDIVAKVAERLLANWESIAPAAEAVLEHDGARPCGPAPR